MESLELANSYDKIQYYPRISQRVGAIILWTKTGPNWLPEPIHSKWKIFTCSYFGLVLINNLENEQAIRKSFIFIVSSLTVEVSNIQHAFQKTIWQKCQLSQLTRYQKKTVNMIILWSISVGSTDAKNKSKAFGKFRERKLASTAYSNTRHTLAATVLKVTADPNWMV